MIIVGLQGSPRKGGNTDRLLAAFLERAEQAGAVTRTIQVAKAGIAACKGCGYCETHGTCVITDDPMATEIYGLLRQADMVVAASPVFFYGVSSQLKGLIDRCQTLWSRKYVYKLKDPLAATRHGVLLSVGASRGRQLFDGIHLTVKYFFDAIDARFDHALTYWGIEAKGAIRNQEGLGADIDAIIVKSVRPLVARKTVLFVSSEGACRGPMAAAMAQMRHGGRICAAAGALKPAKALSAPMVDVMQQAGVDLGYRTPTTIDQALMGVVPDLVIAVDERIEGTPLPGVETIRWPLPVPSQMDRASITRLFHEIETRIDTLIDKIE